MSKKKHKPSSHSRARSAFLAKVNQSFQSIPFDEQVRLALPIARRMIVEGIDIGEHSNDTIVDRVAELMRDKTLLDEYSRANEEDSTTMWDRLTAAQALGIALGLLLRPEMIEGGAR